MTLNVIDISRYQAGIYLSNTGADGVIVGVTYGTAGANPYASAQLDAVNAAGMLRGAYHIRAGDGPTPQAEADSFLASMAGHMDGKTILILDWEECTLSDVAWAKAWLDYVYSRTGIRPIIYMSSSVSLAYDWSSVMADYGLWVAQYPYSTVTGFVGVNWTPPATSWPALVGWQYAGTGGSVGGYTGIDLSAFYITPAQWLAYANPSSVITPEEDMPLTAADVALIWAYKNTAAGDTADMHAQLVAAAASAAAAAAITPATIWAYKNTAAGDTVDMHQTVVNAMASAKASATQAAVTQLGTAVAGVPAAVLNQTFTTAAGATTNVPGILDAINSKPVGVVSLSADQVDQLAATLKTELPAATLAALAAKLTA